jgi:DNA-directed RNA polymerase subunit RPC12/RpoP
MLDCETAKWEGVKKDGYGNNRKHTFWFMKRTTTGSKDGPYKCARCGRPFKEGVAHYKKTSSTRGKDRYHAECLEKVFPGVY